MSSWVGPSPPLMMSASARSRPSRIACTMRAWLSPTFTCIMQPMPDSARCSPIQFEFVSTICPSSNSVPTANTSQVNAMPSTCHDRGNVACTNEIDQAAPYGEHNRDPQHGVPQPAHVVREWEQRPSDRVLLHEGLALRQAARRDADAARAGDTAVEADGDLTHGDDRNGHDPEVVRRDEGEH